MDNYRTSLSTNAPTTHWAECWTDSRHWACAQARVKEARAIACRLLAEKQELEAERAFAQQLGDGWDEAIALIACLQEILDKTQPRRFLGAKLRLPQHLRARIRWPGDSLNSKKSYSTKTEGG